MRELSGFIEAAIAFAAAEAAVHENMANGIEAVAKKIEETAKNEVGFYQPAVGGFPAWDQLAESTEEDKARHGYPLNAPLECTGELKDSFSHQSEGFEAVIGSTDQNLVYQEFGTPRIPPRPVLGPAVIHNGEAIRKIIGHAAVTGLVGGERIHAELGYDKLL